MKQSTPEDFEKSIDTVLAEVKAVLIHKNKQYGNSALEPIRVFAKSDTVEQLKVRIDDKLSRVKRGQGETEDTELDLLGYFVLLRVATGKEAQK